MNCILSKPITNIRVSAGSRGFTQLKQKTYLIGWLNLRWWNSRRKKNLLSCGEALGGRQPADTDSRCCLIHLPGTTLYCMQIVGRAVARGWGCGSLSSAGLQDSWPEDCQFCEFDLWQEQRAENVLLPRSDFVLTLKLISVPLLCYHSST